MLTDENDCSVRDTDVGWVSDNVNDSIPTGSTQCASNPNDKCCYSCTASPPAGCPSSCPNGQAAGVDDGTYQANVRCWNQKRRFGYEFLYPTSRYVVGLTNQVLCPDQNFGDMDCNCTYAQITWGQLQSRKPSDAQSTVQHYRRHYEQWLSSARLSAINPKIGQLGHLPCWNCRRALARHWQPRCQREFDLHSGDGSGLESGTARHSTD